MSEQPFTRDQLLDIIAAAMGAHDMQGVHDALHLLAFVDPTTADLILKALEVARAAKS